MPKAKRVDAEQARQRLLELLAEQGIAKKDYEQIEAARDAVDKVNRRLARRGSGYRYAIVGAFDPGLERAGREMMT